ncbi:cell death protein 3-like [Watersipora subatra]|uniref:cell death protein 3-like n=1 Tax=Watersipora subatra TaxID=2589382 RepID=UPI00355B5DBE
MASKVPDPKPADDPDDDQKNLQGFPQRSGGSRVDTHWIKIPQGVKETISRAYQVKAPSQIGLTWEKYNSLKNFSIQYCDNVIKDHGTNNHVSHINVAEEKPVFADCINNKLEEIRLAEDERTTSVQPQQAKDSSDRELSDTLGEAFKERTVKLCSKSFGKDLFHSSDVYRMSTVRGRCLIINNMTFNDPNGFTDVREGSPLDGQRILYLFHQLGFICSCKEDLSGQRMLEVIRDETDRHADENYGMFVLVIMSNGSEIGISGADGTMVHKTDINNALSAENFPAMARKPKLIIIQACSGDLHDRVSLDPPPATSSPHPGSNLPSFSVSPTMEVRAYLAMTLPTPSRPTTSSVQIHPPGSHAVLNTDDLLIWEASFRGRVAYRHCRYGSWFVNAVVDSLSKHACHRDLKNLFEKQIRTKVRNYSIQRRMGQQPTMTCTLLKDLFLFPGYNPPDPD